MILVCFWQQNSSWFTSTLNDKDNLILVPSLLALKQPAEELKLFFKSCCDTMTTILTEAFYLKENREEEELSRAKKGKTDNSNYVLSAF